MFCMLFWTKWPVFKFHSKCNTIKQKMGHVVMFIIPTNILPILSISECVNNLIMVYTVYCMWSLSSQENGGGPGSSQSVLSQDFFESATSLDRPDTVCGDVSGYQCFYILQWLLQQTWGHVSREGLCARRDEDLWTECSCTTKETPEMAVVLCLCQFIISPHSDSLESMTLTLKGQRRFGRLCGYCCLGHG